MSSSWCANILKIAAGGQAAIYFFTVSAQKENVRKMTPNYKMLLLSVLIVASGCRKDVDQFIIQPDDQPQTGHRLGARQGMVP